MKIWCGAASDLWRHYCDMKGKERPGMRGLSGMAGERVIVSFLIASGTGGKRLHCLELLVLADRSTLTSCCGNTWPTAADTNKGLTSS